MQPAVISAATARTARAGGSMPGCVRRPARRERIECPDMSSLRPAVNGSYELLSSDGIGRSRISMRRFLARPCSLLLEATGCESATETASMRLLDSPASSKRRTTLEARAPASSQFDGYFLESAAPIGLLSVCPLTRICCWDD